MFGKKDKKIEQEEKTQKIDLGDIFLIPESEIPEKQKEQMMIALQNTRKALDAREITSELPTLYEDETGRIKSMWVNPWLPLKTKNENVLWYRTKFDGLINKKLRAFEAVTNNRVYYYDVTQPTPLGYAIVPGIEVVVNNQKRISESQRDGSFAGFGGRGTFIGSSSGYSTGESQTYGDVNLLHEGEIAFTFYTVADPNGLGKLIKYAVDNVEELRKKLEKQDNEATVSKKRENTCAKCGINNPHDSKFCNGCGNKLNPACQKCGKTNPSGSSFCNECGFTLQ